MASSNRQVERVAREKERMSLASGDSASKARRYADEVREGAARRAAEDARRGKR